MYNCENCKGYENNESRSVLTAIILIIAALSFVLGFIAGHYAAKKIYIRRLCRGKKTVTTDYGDFDADEYVRSLNLD